MGHFLALIGLLLGAPESELRFVSHRWLATPASRDEAAALDAGLAYVYANIGGPVTLSEAARRARMSQPTFSKYFRRASGGTFTEVVRTLRIAKARELLTHTTDPIAAICFAAGFSGLTNFNRQFRRETGMTPREYRTASRSAAQHS
nr:AraC family transcriptional regulator [Galbitalea soli]